MLRVAVVIGGLLCSTAQAQQRTEQSPATDRADAGSTGGTLSEEDAELVKDLAVLERMELLRNLELFEDPKELEKGEERKQ
jgi:hypothetical protein